MFEIGSSLREARLRQGLDLPEVEQATKIRGKYLRALEDEQFELLPSETYVKGFLRTYAEYLGLDGQLYVDEFNSRFVTGEDELRVRRSTVRPPRRNRPVPRAVAPLARDRACADPHRRGRARGARARAARRARRLRPRRGLGRARSDARRPHRRAARASGRRP